jgi:hypothetical protein
MKQNPGGQNKVACLRLGFRGIIMIFFFRHIGHYLKDFFFAFSLHNVTN